MSDITDIGVAAVPEIIRMADGLISHGRLDYWHQRDKKDQYKREDTEIQRRVQDAINAGINPYDAISGGAGAGSASPSTSVNSSSGLFGGAEIGAGSLFDYKIGKEQVKQAEEDTKQKQEETKQSESNTSILKSEAEIKKREADLNGREYKYLTDPDYFDKEHTRTPFWTNFNNKVNEQMANTTEAMENAERAGKLNKWENTNQVFNKVISGLGAVGSSIIKPIGIFRAFKRR